MTPSEKVKWNKGRRGDFDRSRKGGCISGAVEECNPGGLRTEIGGHSINSVVGGEDVAGAVGRGQGGGLQEGKKASDRTWHSKGSRMKKIRSALLAIEEQHHTKKQKRSNTPAVLSESFEERKILSHDDWTASNGAEGQVLLKQKGTDQGPPSTQTIREKKEFKKGVTTAPTAAGNGTASSEKRKRRDPHLPIWRYCRFRKLQLKRTMQDVRGTLARLLSPKMDAGKGDDEGRKRKISIAFQEAATESRPVP